ncbi:MAG: hypothetical protein KAR31_03450, partial [Candidatus Omnitrophica bacterium]|nr:hypothetical protein [Candidatus Omnitrophota bacterium]
RNRNFMNIWTRSNIFMAGCIVFFTVFGVQAVEKYRFDRSAGAIQFSRLSLSDKLVSWNRHAYTFAVYCRRILNGRYQGILVTDLETNGKDMLLHRKLSFFLYPVVHIRGNKKKADCMVVFMKNNPMESVPDDFEVVGVYSENSLIALRKN